MFKNTTIKIKFFLASIIAVTGFLIMAYLLYSSVNDVKQFGDAQSSVSKLKVDMLTLRRNEKDFLLRKDLKYKAKFKSNVAILQKDSAKLKKLLKVNSLDENSAKVTKFTSTIVEYKNIFLRLVAKQQEIGLNPKDGLYGKLRDRVHVVQNIAKSLNDEDLLAKVYELRKHEKDFMLRSDTKYVQQFKIKIDKLITSTTGQVHKNLVDYKISFLKLVKAQNEIGLSSETGLRGEMRTIVHKTEKLLKKLLVDTKTEIDNEVSNLYTMALILTTILVVSMMLMAYFISHNILNSLNLLNKAITAIRRDRDVSHRIKLVSNDEIGDIVKNFNKYLVDLEDGIKEDKIFIEDVQAVMSRVGSGWFSQRIEKETNNPTLILLKSTINDGLENLKTIFKDMATILEHYSRFDYSKDVIVDGIEKNGVFDKLVLDIGNLRGAIVSMIEVSSHSSTQLLSKADFLDTQMGLLKDSTIEQSKSLESTTLAMNHITELIEDTSQKANEVVSQTEDIKSIVGIIGDIAEQTNLLALNAAIEAARAGEHGRGFAVVADEVRKLAERTQKSLSEINVNVNVLTQSIADIGGSINEQSDSISKINTSIVEIDKTTKSNSITVHEVSVVANEVQGMATEILRDTNKNKI